MATAIHKTKVAPDNLVIPTKEPTLSDLFPYPNLEVNKTACNAYESKQPSPTYSVLCPTALVGLELEIENIREHVPIEHYWQIKNDDSLRNHGLEFVSQPLRMYQVEYALKHLNNTIHSYNNPQFSSRCSVHVHVNVRDMTWKQLKTFVFLYAIFEKHFFHIAGTRREENIFCVPLYKSDQLQYVKTFDTKAKWNKYNALNLSTIVGSDVCQKYGTIEFRHLYGTLNTETIINWLNNIMCLREALQMITYDELLDRLRTMNTTSDYLAMYAKVFGPYADMRRMSKMDFEYCITQVKQALWASEYDATIVRRNTSALVKVIMGAKNHDEDHNVAMWKVPVKKFVIPKPAGIADMDYAIYQAKMQELAKKMNQINVPMPQNFQQYYADANTVNVAQAQPQMIIADDWPDLDAAEEEALEDLDLDDLADPL